MSITNIFGIAGSGLNAQLVRLNLTASNLANSGVSSSTEDQAFRAKRPIFKALVDKAMTNAGSQYVGGVKIDGIVNDKAAVSKLYQPGNPQADKDGYVYGSNVSEITEMVEMMSASRAYQNNVEVINTARDLAARTIDLIKT
jgi:flagellar basal-body rod protein FlgC